ncbi:unnamed protein product, partial [Heterotrigona itama]
MNKHIKTTSFHPQCNGSLENAHVLIEGSISTKDRDREWDEIFNLVCFGYNNAMHEGIECIEFELTFSRKAQLPNATAATIAMSKEEIFHLWKRRHEFYLAGTK